MTLNLSFYAILRPSVLVQPKEMKTRPYSPFDQLTLSGLDVAVRSS
jgi:hypothetical protein